MNIAESDGVASLLVQGQTVAPWFVDRNSEFQTGLQNYIHVRDNIRN